MVLRVLGLIGGASVGPAWGRPRLLGLLNNVGLSFALQIRLPVEHLAR